MIRHTLLEAAAAAGAALPIGARGGGCAELAAAAAGRLAARFARAAALSSRRGPGGECHAGLPRPLHAGEALSLVILR